MATLLNTLGASCRRIPDDASIEYSNSLYKKSQVIKQIKSGQTTKNITLLMNISA